MKSPSYIVRLNKLNTFVLKRRSAAGIGKCFVTEQREAGSRKALAGRWGVEGRPDWTCLGREGR